MTILTEESIDEIRGFIVDSNLEFSLLNQCKSNKIGKNLKEWLGVD